MPKGHAVVDGSNIATEGSTEPSLKQLREAVAEFEAENDFKHVTVIVDASFEHRVSEREKRGARAAVDAGEIITPPAGVVGRGDAFILEVADRAGAVVLSNDSFQEFHGTYTWLFDEGRLIGGKPVPGVGWVYVARTPVRGPVSRRATKATTKRSTATKSTAPATKKSAASRKSRTTKKTTKAAKKASAPARASTKAPPDGDDPGTNTVAALRAFRRSHPLGSTVEATVEKYSSHGAYGSADGAVVYFPNRLLDDPPPNRARDTVSIGETREFIVQRFDDERRGIDLGLLPVAGAAKSPAPKTATKKRASTRSPAKATTKKAPRKQAAKKAAKKTTKTATRSTAKKTTTKSTAKKSAKRPARSRTFDNTKK